MVASLLAVTAGLLGFVPAGAVAVVSLNVTPGNGLVSGQWVSAAWSGVEEGTPVYIRQCTLNPVTIRDCSYLGSNALHYGGIAPASGEGSMRFPVAGELNGGNATDRFTCDSLHACSIALFTDPTATSITKAAFDPIDFAVSSDTCPAPLSSDVVVSGRGTLTVSRAFRGWQGRLCRTPNFLDVTYRATSSLDGEAAFVEEDAMFAMTSQPLAHTSVQRLADQHRRFAYAPMVGSGLAFGFRMVDPVTGQPITSLNLTAPQLARIFTGQLQDLNSDPDIVSQNPGITFPPVVRAIGRADASAQTRLLTSWFLSVARRAYRLGGPAFAGGASDSFPQSATITLLPNARAVANAVGNPFLPDLSQLGTIGWMDSSVAAMYDLPTAMVQNHAGEFVAASPQAIRAGILGMGVNPDGVTRYPRFLSGDPKAYPLPVITYMVAQTSVTSAFDRTEADVLRRFIKFAASRSRPGLAVSQLGGQTKLPDGYVALPNPIARDALQAADQLPTTSYQAPGSPGPGFTPGTPGTPGIPGSEGGGPQPGGNPSGSPLPSVSASPTPGLPTGLLPPATLASSGAGYVWPTVLIIGLALVALGTLLSAALRFASSRGAKKALAAASAEPEELA